MRKCIIKVLFDHFHPRYWGSRVAVIETTVTTVFVTDLPRRSVAFSPHAKRGTNAPFMTLTHRCQTPRSVLPRHLTLISKTGRETRPGWHPVCVHCGPGFAYPAWQRDQSYAADPLSPPTPEALC